MEESLGENTLLENIFCIIFAFMIGLIFNNFYISILLFSFTVFFIFRKKKKYHFIITHSLSIFIIIRNLVFITAKIIDNSLKCKILEEIDFSENINILILEIIFIILLNQMHIQNIKKFLMKNKVILFIFISFLLLNFKLSKLIYSNDIYFLLTVFFLLLKILKNIFNKKVCKKELYISRKIEATELERYLKDDRIKTILINGKWGIGKTFFIEYFFENVNNNEITFIPVWIKSTFYKDKLEIRTYILEQLKLILSEEGLSTYEIKKILKSFSLESKIPGISFLENTFEVNREKIQDLLSTLENKRIVLIIDDLDRRKVEEVNEIITLIAEVEWFFNIKTLFLIDFDNYLNKIKELKIYDENFYDKYFSKTIRIKEVSCKEIIERELDKSDFNDPEKEIIINFFTKLENKILSNPNNIIKKIRNPRYLIKFLFKIKEKFYSDYYKNRNTKNKILNTIFFIFILEEEFNSLQDKIKENFLNNSNLIESTLFNNLQSEEKEQLKNLYKFLKEHYIELENTENNTPMDIDLLIQYGNEEKISRILEEYRQNKLKTYEELKNESSIKLRLSEKEKQEFIKNSYSVLKESYNKNKIDLLELLELYYFYFGFKEIDIINFLNENENYDEIKNINNPIFWSKFSNIDSLFINSLKTIIITELGNQYFPKNIDYSLSNKKIFKFTDAFITTNISEDKKPLNDFNKILITEALKIFKNSILKQLKQVMQKEKINTNYYEISKITKDYFFEEIIKIENHINFLLPIIEELERRKEINSTIDKEEITKIKIRDMNTPAEIRDNLLDVTLNNYYTLYSYTGRDIMENLDHIKNVLKNRKDILYPLLSMFGINEDGTRLYSEEYNEIIENLKNNNEYNTLSYATSFFQVEVNKKIINLIKKIMKNEKSKNMENLIIWRIDCILNEKNEVIYILQDKETKKFKTLENSKNYYSITYSKIKNFK